MSKHDEDLAATLDGLTPRNGGAGLKVDQMLTSLPPGDAEAFRRALEDPDRAKARHLAEVMTAAGHVVSAHAIDKWRKATGVTQ